MTSLGVTRVMAKDFGRVAHIEGIVGEGCRVLNPARREKRPSKLGATGRRVYDTPVGTQ
jgi:hypothetical protein